MNKFFLSALLLLPSFAKGTCSGTSVTISSDNSTLECSPSSTYNLTVTEQGKLKKVTLKSSAVIDNKGQIIDPTTTQTNSNSVNSYGVRVHNVASTITLTNSGTIEGGQYGVNFDSVAQTITIHNLTNSGTINGKNNEGVYFGGQVVVKSLSNTGLIKGSQGFWITEKSNKRPEVKHMSNSGTIEGNTRGIVLNQSTIETLENKGKIIGKSHAALEIRKDSTLKKLIIDGESAEFKQNNGTANTYNATDNSSSKGGIHNRGTITSIELKNNAKAGDLINAKTNGGTSMTLGKIESLSVASGSSISILENAGTISTINVSGANSKISKLENTGTINNISSTNGGEITELINKSSGNITGTITLNEKTKTISNEGTISGSLHFNESVTKLDNKGNISNFTAHKEIKDLSNSKSLTLSGQGLITGSLKQEKGATLDGVAINFHGQNIELDNKGTINNHLHNPQSSILTKVHNEGSLKYLHNEGEILTFNNKQNASITTLINKGSIVGGLINEGNIDHLENLGQVKPTNTNEHIKNDAGKIVVKKWYIRSNRRIPLATHKNFVSLNDADSRLVITGANSTNVDFSQAEIYIDAHQYDFNVPYDIKHSILLKNSPHRPSSAKPISIQNFADVQAYNISYNSTTQQFIINPNSQALYGAVFADFLINYIQRRTTFLDTLLLDENTKLLSRHNPDDKHWFFLPFYGYDDFSLTTRKAGSRAYTRGFISSFHYFDRDNFYEFFIGLSRANSKTHIHDAGKFMRLDGKHEGTFTGLKYKRFLYEGIAWQNTAKLAKRKADLSLNQESADKVSDGVDIYGYGLATHVEFYHNTDTQNLRFKSGVGFEGFRIGAFNLSVQNEAQKINIFHNNISVSWTKKWLPAISSTLELGNKFLFNNKVKTHFQNDRDYFRLPKNYTFTQTSLQFDVRKNFALSLSYNGSFAHNGNSHNGFFSANYKW